MRQRCSDANTPYHDRTRRRTNGRGDLSLHRRTEQWPDRAGKARKEGVGQERDWRHRSENPGPRAQSHSARPRRGSSAGPELPARSEEHTSELQSLMRISYAVLCLKKKKNKTAPRVDISQPT